MKTIIIKSILLLTLMTWFSACSSSDDSSSETKESSISDVVLTSGKSISCSDENSFSIEPSDGDTPNITFSTNTTTGVTTITYNSVDGSATVVGCKQ